MFQPSQQMTDLARSVAVRHELDGALVCAVIEQESGWDAWALRYEAGFLQKYIEPLFAAKKISATEAYMRSMSWGLMQVMGEDARELGFKGEFLSELCDPETGIEYGCRILANRMKTTKGDVEAALLAYNGGGNKAYPGEVLARVKNYEPSGPGPIAISA